MAEIPSHYIALALYGRKDNDWLRLWQMIVGWTRGQR
jgi:hypothetical protein